jgi:HEPN domain-containing protein
MNRTAAIEWLRIAYHDLKSAQILFEANHYTDSIGNDLQQSLEKTLKAVIAHKNQRIPKSHDLLEIFECVKSDVFLEEGQIVLLAKATEYHKEDRYPNPSYSLPPREEIYEVLQFSEELFARVYKTLGIDPSEVKR